MKQTELGSVGQGVATVLLFSYMGVECLYKAYIERDFYAIPSAALSFGIAGVIAYETMELKLSGNATEHGS